MVSSEIKVTNKKVVTLRDLFCTRATEQLKLLEPKLSIMTGESKFMLECYVSELKWIINSGFKSRSVRQIQSEFVRLAKEMDGRETWTETFKNADVRMNAIEAVTEWTSEVKSKLLLQTVPTAHPQRSVEMQPRALEPRFHNDVILDKSGDVFETVGQQEAVCPFCGAINIYFDLKYVRGRNSLTNEDLSGRNYPFAAELNMVDGFKDTLCRHHQFAAAGIGNKNYMVFQGALVELKETREKMEQIAMAAEAAVAAFECRPDY